MIVRSMRVVLVGTLLAVGTLATTEASEKGVASYRVAKAEVVIVCPLTIGGSFEAKTNAMSGELDSRPEGAINGSLQVDLQTLDTGIGLRTRHMRDNYLEVQKGPDYATATLEDIRVERLDGKTAIKGMLRLHGIRRAVTGTAEIRQENGRARVEAQFPVRVSDFQIPKPSYLGVGVRDEVQVKVSMTVLATSNTVARR